METATQEPAKPAPNLPTDVPAAIDPEKDIDTKSTVTWLTVCFVLVGVMLWVLAQWFAFAVQKEHERKIDNAPTTELIENKGLHDFYLKNAKDAALLKSGPEGDEAREIGDIDKSIRATTDQVIRTYVQK